MSRHLIYEVIKHVPYIAFNCISKLISKPSLFCICELYPCMKYTNCKCAIVTTYQF